MKLSRLNDGTALCSSKFTPYLDIYGDGQACPIQQPIRKHALIINSLQSFTFYFNIDDMISSFAAVERAGLRPVERPAAAGRSQANCKLLECKFAPAMWRAPPSTCPDGEHPMRRCTLLQAPSIFSSFPYLPRSGIYHRIAFYDHPTPTFCLQKCLVAVLSVSTVDCSFTDSASARYTLLISQTLHYVMLKVYSAVYSLCGPMNNQTNVDSYRKELSDLAFLQNLVKGENARKALHDRMLLVASKLREATS